MPYTQENRIPSPLRGHNKIQNTGDPRGEDAVRETEANRGEG